MGRTSVLVGIISVQFLLISYLFYEKCQVKLNGTEKMEREIPTATGKILMDLPHAFSTSVFCTGKNKPERECRFTNLCYDPKLEKFLFFHGGASKQFGLPNTPSRSPLLDLSSVDDHNAMYFSYTDVKRQSYGDRKMHFVPGGSIVFNRFNPENIMHVLHDDLLPYFHTKRKYYPSINVTTICCDGRDKGPFFDLYQLFMERMIMKEMLSELTCFEDTVVGVSKATTWYQYGFREPQGPIVKADFPTAELFYFKEMFLNRLSIKGSDLNHEQNIVLFTRKETRRITNEIQLMLKLSSHFKMAVTSVDLQSDDLKDIVTSVSNAKYVIGVHGAHLITSLFLPPGSIIVEIFPFAIPSENYTPYKTLAKILNLSYVAWENKNEGNSISYPDRPSHFGGISHLSVEMQQRIVNTKTVPEHLCCQDPFWLYRIYQDIRVDVSDFMKHIEKVMRNRSRGEMFSQVQSYFFPDKVTNLSCPFNEQVRTLNISWSPPLNMAWVKTSDLSYDVLLQSSAKEGDVNELLNVKGELSVLVSVEEVADLTIFVRCKFDGIVSEFLQCVNYS